MTRQIELTGLCDKKASFLEEKGLIQYGVILQGRRGDGTYERATVDKFGRVQWWVVDGAGKMVAEGDAQRG